MAHEFYNYEEDREFMRDMWPREDPPSTFDKTISNWIRMAGSSEEYSIYAFDAVNHGVAIDKLSTLSDDDDEDVEIGLMELSHFIRQCWEIAAENWKSAGYESLPTYARIKRREGFASVTVFYDSGHFSKWELVPTDNLPVVHEREFGYEDEEGSPVTYEDMQRGIDDWAHAVGVPPWIVRLIALTAHNPAVVSF